MIPLLVYTYHKRPAWRVPIAILIIILLSSPLLLLIYNPFQIIFGKDSQLSNLSAFDAISQLRNWTFTAPNGAILPFHHGPKVSIPDSKAIDPCMAEAKKNVSQNSTNFVNCSSNLGAEKLQEQRLKDLKDTKD